MNQQIPTPAPSVEDFLAQTEPDEEHDEQIGFTVNPTDFRGKPLSVGPGQMWVVPPDPMERVAAALEALVDYQTKPLGELVEKYVDRNHLHESVGSSIAGVSMVPVTAHDALREELTQTFTEELADLEAKYATVLQVISDVEAALGKSTAKPVLAAKAVIEAYKNPTVPETEQDEITGTEGLDNALQNYPTPALQMPVFPGHTRAESANDGEPDICRECSYAAQDYVTWPCPEVQQAFNPLGVEHPKEPEHQPAHSAPVEEWREYARALGYAGPDIDKANRSQIRTALGITQPVSQES